MVAVSQNWLQRVKEGFIDELVQGLGLEGWVGVYQLRRGERISKQIVPLWSYDPEDEGTQGLFECSGKNGGVAREEAGKGVMVSWTFYATLSYVKFILKVRELKRKPGETFHVLESPA